MEKGNDVFRVDMDMRGRIESIDGDTATVRWFDFNSVTKVPITKLRVAPTVSEEKQARAEKRKDYVRFMKLKEFAKAGNELTRREKKFVAEMEEKVKEDSLRFRRSSKAGRDRSLTLRRIQQLEASFEN